MKDGFTRKKVESLTLGEKLKKLRSDLRMSLADVSKGTKIQAKYLEYLENGEYEKLPADVYVRGFLRSYARYLNIDEKAFVRLYERERNIQANLGREQPARDQARDFSTASLVITPRSVVMALIVLSVVGAFFYLYQEFKSFAAAPRLVILEPASNAVIEASEAVVRGKTDKGARVSINNQTVFVGGEGEFSDKLILQPGLNTVTIVAVNRFDKEKSETISLEARYTPSVPDANLSGESALKTAEETFHVEIAVRDAATKVVAKADGAIVYSGILKPGETQRIEAKENITIASENGQQTQVRFNGGTEEPLSQSKGAVKEAIFTKAGKQV